MQDPPSPHICPIDNTPFEGACPVKSCWFHGSPRHPSCCSRLAVGNKERMGPADIGYLFSMPTRQAKLAIERGQQKIKAWIQVCEILDDNGTPPEIHCKQCGMRRLTRGDCVNREMCEQRQRIINKVRRNPIVTSRYPQLKSHQLYRVARLGIETLGKVGLKKLKRLQQQEDAILGNRREI